MPPLIVGLLEATFAAVLRLAALLAPDLLASAFGGVCRHCGRPGTLLHLEGGIVHLTCDRPICIRSH